MKKTFAMLVALSAVQLAFADAPRGDAARGQKLFMTNLCYTCHGTAGQGGDRGSGPRIAYDVWPWEGFAQQVRHPRESMPRYSVQQLADQDLADIYAYVASMKRGPRAAEIPLLRE
jgi:mono/diheme cytochrome c family protein